jgi:hypothetical protein
VVKTFLARNHDHGGLAVFVDEFHKRAWATGGRC